MADASWIKPGMHIMAFCRDDSRKDEPWMSHIVGRVLQVVRFESDGTILVDQLTATCFGPSRWSSAFLLDPAIFNFVGLSDAYVEAAMRKD